jgi:predicted DNA repair protein MutK
LGVYLVARGGVRRSIGAGILKAAPYLMKTLSIAGTAAMFLVGGGILVHGIPPLHHFVENLAAHAHAVAGVGAVLSAIVSNLANALVGIIAGGLLLLAYTAVKRAKRSTQAAQ